MKLSQFFGKKVYTSLGLPQRVAAHAAGNPFNIEELLNVLCG